MCVEVFAAAADGEDDFADPARTHRPGYTPDLSDDLVRDGLQPFRPQTPVRTGRGDGKLRRDGPETPV